MQKNTALNKRMIKRLLLFMILSGFLVASSYALAQETATGSAAPQSSIDADKVQALKEKLATKVAELRENQTRGFYGTIASLSKTSFTLVTGKEEIKVRYSEDALVFNLEGTKKEAKTTDLKNSQTVSVLGLFDAEDTVVTAKFILIQTQPRLVIGDVTTIDKTGGTVTLKTQDGKTQAVEYEKTTTSSEYQLPDKKIVRSGLSRFAVGDRIYTWVLETSENDGTVKLSATRMLRIPKAVLHPEEAPNPSPSPSPTNRATPRPSATPATSPET